jgi:hypothetical protein
MAGVDALGILPGDWSRNYGGTNLLAVLLTMILSMWRRVTHVTLTQVILMTTTKMTCLSHRRTSLP